jgi:hypothetical protein
MRGKLNVLAPRSRGFKSRYIRLKFVLGNAAIGDVFLHVPWLLPASIIPPILLLISILMYSYQKDRRAETGHLQRNAYGPSGNTGQESDLMLLKLASLTVLQ